MEKEVTNQMDSKNEPYEPATYYDEAYFNFQKVLGEFSGRAETGKFKKYISPGDTVIDFGCGGGFILKNINCSKKIGVEISDVAREYAGKVNGIHAVKFVEDLDDAIGDVIISTHALEHCYNPRVELVNLLKKLKPGGLIVFFVPSEGIANKWRPGDVNNHLYTWNSMTLGNLFTSAGYEIEIVQAYHRKWPPFYRKVIKLGDKVFNLLSIIYGNLKRSYSQVKIVARRPV
jgi:SAM-dependent methyltransferase